MLRRFFKGRDRLNDPDPNVRRDAVRELDPARALARASELAALLTADPDRSVRLAIIERIDAVDVLARVLDDDRVGDAAARRILTLARGRGVTLPDHPRLRALGLLQATPDEQLARVASMADPEQLIALALKDRGALRSAVLAHPALQTGTALALLEKRSRGSDKSLNRHARETLDRLRRLQQQAAAARERAEELVQSLARTTAASDRAAWEREVHLYQQCTAALANYDAARVGLEPFGETLPMLEELRSRVVPPTPRPEPATPAPTKGAGSTPEPARDERPSPAGDEPAVAGGPAAEPTRATVAAGEPCFQPASAEPASTAAAAVAAAAATAQAQREADAREADARDADAREATARAAREAAAAARQTEYEALDQLLDTLEENITAGHLATARQQLTDVRNRCEALGPDAPRRIGRRVSRLGSAFAELRDWQNYVTAPKREALCEAVQALADHPLAPPDQAERLKALRADWRELGPIVKAGEARLAERFNALAERAFEPCREYFARQAEVRRANLAERERICSQLAQYLSDTDWQRADMKAAEQILRAARESWREYLPVDRGPGKAVEVRFEALQAELHDKLKAFWESNADAKQQIVGEAEALLAEDGDLEARIGRIKGLQQRWKGIGPTMPRARDQALWSAFRTACDALFATREAARHAADSETRQLAGQCAAALDAFADELATLTPDTPLEARARALREQLRPLDTLPPALRQPLAARRAELLDRHQTLVREQGRAARRARLEELKFRDAAFSAAETAHRDGGPAPEVPEHCFADRVGRHADAVPLDALRRLTLRVEQAAGIAPPPEDEPLRLEVQVERLRAGLGGADDETPLQLAERWCALGPKDVRIDPLRERFFAALAARLTP